jgi:multicomponent Na+:H+ antiporter subunit D
VLFPGERLDDLLMWVALLTMVVGILGALAQIDIKRMLSFTLISHIGYMIFGVAVGTQEALSATVYYVAHHIVIQTSLFLVAGLIERRGGSTNVDRLAGMAKISPLLALLYLVPALNLGGIPPFSGFLGKTGLLQAGVDQGDGLAYALVAGSVAVSLLTLLALIRVWNRVFLRAPEDAEYPDPILLAPVPAGSRFLLTSGAVDDQAGRFAGKGDVRLMSPSMLGGASALVAAGVALTVFAGPLFQLADNAAENLVRPERYVEAVLDPASAPRPVVEEAP